jgi:hypothetical protein
MVTTNENLPEKEDGVLFLKEPGGQRCQMQETGKRQVQHKMPKTAKRRFKKCKFFFTLVGSRI